MQVLSIAKDNPKFKAIDRAIGKESFKVVTLLRLSPLLPLALSNYFYGITRWVLLRVLCNTTRQSKALCVGHHLDSMNVCTNEQSCSMVQVTMFGASLGLDECVH